MRVVVVPAKEFTSAKERLADALPAPGASGAGPRHAGGRPGRARGRAGRPRGRRDPRRGGRRGRRARRRAGRQGAGEPRTHGGRRARGRALPGVGRHGDAHRPRRSPLPHGRGGPPHPGRLRIGAGGRIRAVPERARHERGLPRAARRRPVALRRAVLRGPPRGGPRTRHRARDPEPRWRRARHRPARGSRRAPAGGPPNAGGADPRRRRPVPPRRAPELEVFGIRGMPELRPGDDLAALTLARGRGPGHAVRGRRRRRAQPEGGLQGRGPPGASSTTSRRPRSRSRSGTRTRRIPG